MIAYCGRPPAAARSALNTTSTPMKLRTQQLVIVVSGRMQQRDAFLGGLHLQPLTRLNASEHPTIAGQLGPGLRILEQLHFHYGSTRDHDRSIRQSVGADR